MEWLAEQPNGQTGGEPRFLTVNGRSSIPSEKIDAPALKIPSGGEGGSPIADLSLSRSLFLSLSLFLHLLVFPTHALYRDFLRAS